MCHLSASFNYPTPDSQFLLGQRNICQKLSVNISIIFRHLASIHQNFHESPCTKLLGMQKWRKKSLNESKDEDASTPWKSPNSMGYSTQASGFLYQTNNNRETQVFFGSFALLRQNL